MEFDDNGEKDNSEDDDDEKDYCKQIQCHQHLLVAQVSIKSKQIYYIINTAE